MREPLAKRAFYESATFRLALVYLAACAFAVVWSEAHLARQFYAAWLFWRHTPLPSNEDYLSWGPQEQEMYRAAYVESFGAGLCRDVLIHGYRAALIAVPFVAALGAIARLVARARVRAGQSDPLAGVRAFAARHPVIAALVPAIMGLAYEVTSIERYRLGGLLVMFAVTAATVFLVHFLLTRLALRLAFAPTLEERNETPKETVDEDFAFAAVALTREARLAVAGLAVLTAALVAVLLALPKFDHLAVDISVALYVPIAIFSALYFRRASRIAVGLDGIHVHGSSRSHFYAFHELDDVRTNGGIIELLRSDRPVLRLQLHGPDAVRREALTERLAAAVARAKEERDQPVTRFVNAATRGDLARAADGGGSYRHAAVSRDQLWAALEGPAVASSARVAAAEALAASTDPSERERLRVATERCAEPLVRERLQELLEDDEETDLAPILAARRFARG